MSDKIPPPRPHVFLPPADPSADAEAKEKQQADENTDSANWYGQSSIDFMQRLAVRGTTPVSDDDIQRLYSLAEYGLAWWKEHPIDLKTGQPSPTLAQRYDALMEEFSQLIKVVSYAAIYWR